MLAFFPSAHCKHIFCRKQKWCRFSPCYFANIWDYSTFGFGIEWKNRRMQAPFTNTRWRCCLWTRSLVWTVLRICKDALKVLPLLLYPARSVIRCRNYLGDILHILSLRHAQSIACLFEMKITAFITQNSRYPETMSILYIEEVACVDLIISRPIQSLCIKCVTYKLLNRY